MNYKILATLIYRLAAIIATLEQAVILGEPSEKIHQAIDLLKEGRLRLMEEAESEAQHDL